MILNKQNRIIIVLGPTGNQGKSVVSSLLSDESRVVECPRSHQGSSQPYFWRYFDIESLQNAFSGAYGVFAVTSETSSRTIEKEDDLKLALESGKNIVAAAKICRIQHFVLGSLPGMRRATSGRFDKLFHMDHKFVIEQWAKQNLFAVTCLLPDSFVWTCSRSFLKVSSSPTWIVRSTIEEKISPDRGSPVENTSNYCSKWGGSYFSPLFHSQSGLNGLILSMIWVFLLQVFASGIAKTKNKNYVVCSPKLRMDEFASTFTRVTGQPAIYSPISMDEWADLASKAVGNEFKEDIRQMMEWISIAPEDKICYGALDPVEDSSWDLHFQATSFETWLRRSGWRGPPEGSRDML
ncbi:cinnamoyl-CoA reductase [Penicillium sp. IBT 35674x]|nr:cinnamoyl-CoA reductase [Penicillium sp. IBT 35674x]